MFDLVINYDKNDFPQVLFQDIIEGYNFDHFNNILRHIKNEFPDLDTLKVYLRLKFGNPMLCSMPVIKAIR